MIFPIPNDEIERLASLREANVLDSPPEDRFDRLTRLARKAFNVPISMLTMLDRDRQWFKSAQGHSQTESPRRESFCQHTILGDEPLVVNNAAGDPRFATLPAVADMGLKFYAGVPVHGPDNRLIGTFCILDFKERHLDSEDLVALEDLARCAESELKLSASTEAERKLLLECDQLRRQASIDRVTRCWNSQALRTLLAQVRKRNSSDGRSCLAVLMIEIGRLKEVNDAHGGETGDAVLREVANRLRYHAPADTILGREEGTRFLIIFPRLDAESAKSRCEKIVQASMNPDFRLGRTEIGLELSGGLVFATAVGESDEAIIQRLQMTLSRDRTGGPGSVAIAI